jgi:hypothetical protein
VPGHAALRRRRIVWPGVVAAVPPSKSTESGFCSRRSACRRRCRSRHERAMKMVSVCVAVGQHAPRGVACCRDLPRNAISSNRDREQHVPRAPGWHSTVNALRAHDQQSSCLRSNSRSADRCGRTESRGDYSGRRSRVSTCRSPAYSSYSCGFGLRLGRLGSPVVGMSELTP